jgi:catechol 2,3-dioxygenase-like lactoylglutathione lyase family enzyme
MFDHLSLGVRDLAAARRFYDAFFAPLGAAVSAASARELAYGPGGEGGLFYLYPVDGPQVAGLGAHLAFAAETRAAVDAAYAAAMAEGATSIRAAGPHPDIAPGYYGCVLLDPDGNKLEIVAGTMH